MEKHYEATANPTWVSGMLPILAMESLHKLFGIDFDVHSGKMIGFWVSTEVADENGLLGKRKDG